MPEYTVRPGDAFVAVDEFGVSFSGWVVVRSRSSEEGMTSIARPLAALSALCCFALAGAAETAPDAAKPRWEMTTYQLCFFKNAASAPEMAEEAFASARAGHID